MDSKISHYSWNDKILVRKSTGFFDKITDFDYNYVGDLHKNFCDEENNLLCMFSVDIMIDYWKY